MGHRQCTSALLWALCWTVFRAAPPMAVHIAVRVAKKAKHLLPDIHLDFVRTLHCKTTNQTEVDRVPLVSRSLFFFQAPYSRRNVT